MMLRPATMGSPPRDLPGHVNAGPVFTCSLEHKALPMWSQLFVGPTDDARINAMPIVSGVWRGGATIFMRAVLKAYGATDRLVWVVDSFEGLPHPNATKYPADDRDKHHTYSLLRVDVEQVKENFKRYGLLDEQVRFLKGWFRDTLPSLAKQRWAVVRLDGDMYESTMDGLVNLYPNLSVGGYLIVDDYGAIPSCRQAVEDYRRAQGIDDPIQAIDWTGVFWRRSA